MNTVIINGRRVQVPDAPTPEEIASASGIRPGRRIIRKTREGNYPLKPGSRISINPEDRFSDAPQRVKGV